MLGAVKASSLRAAAACRGASGLDRACAQRGSWLLRDGRLVDGLEEGTAIVIPAQEAHIPGRPVLVLRTSIADSLIAEFDDVLERRYSASALPMPLGIPFISPDVKR